MNIFFAELFSAYISFWQNLTNFKGETTRKERERKGRARARETMLGAASEWLLRRVFRFLLTTFLGKYVRVVDEVESEYERNGRRKNGVGSFRKERNEEKEEEEEEEERSSVEEDDGEQDRRMGARIEGSAAENGAIVLENVVLKCDEVNQAMQTVCICWQMLDAAAGDAAFARAGGLCVPMDCVSFTCHKCDAMYNLSLDMCDD